jgi:hypothetical protein
MARPRKDKTAAAAGTTTAPAPNQQLLLPVAPQQVTLLPQQTPLAALPQSQVLPDNNAATLAVSKLDYQRLRDSVSFVFSSSHQDNTLMLGAPAASLVLHVPTSLNLFTCASLCPHNTQCPHIASQLYLIIAHYHLLHSFMTSLLCALCIHQ